MSQASPPSCPGGARKSGILVAKKAAQSLELRKGGQIVRRVLLALEPGRTMVVK
jgi:hypothetical protein